MAKKTKAFTILEMLVVVIVIAIIATMSLIVYSRVRRLSRDTVRVTHVTQIQTALRAYFRDMGYYPTSVASGTSLVGNNTTYMEQVPNYPKPVDGACPDDSSYVYQQLPGGTGYTVTFCLGGDTADLKSGFNVASPGGIVNQ